MTAPRLPLHRYARYAPGMAGFVSYLRVSTDKQGKSKLGLEAQRHAIARYLGDDHRLYLEFVEVESGRDNERPELAKAVVECRARGATLLVAKLDRLSRDAAFIMSFARDAGVSFVLADMPDADETHIGIRAVLAQDEARKISTRTKEALQALKARGVKLGGYRGTPPDDRAREAATARLKAIADSRAHDLANAVRKAQQGGSTSLQAIADYLNENGYRTARGGPWRKSSVGDLLKRLESI